MGDPATTTTTNGRYYTAESYLLPSDDEERVRLERQHEVVVNHVPLMWPAELRFEHGDAVLDAGTGTGIWTTTLAKLCPASVNITGIDIESNLFPPSKGNTQFLVHSSLDLPAEWTSNFTLVHQRFMICAFSADAWRKCIAEFFRTLKPGGWVRLEEFDCYRALDGYRSPSPLNGKYIVALRSLAESRGIDPDYLAQLTGLLEETGFCNVQVTKSMILLGGDNGRRTTMGAWRAMKSHFLRLGGLGLGSTEEAFDTFMRDMDDELRGSLDEFMVVTWTAQKPLTL